MSSNKNTKSKISAAFLDLYATSDIKNITVGKIAKKADINRCTFYNYYTDISELQSEVEDNIILHIEHKLNSTFLNNNNSEIHNLLSEFVDSFDSIGDTLYTLCIKHNNTGFRKRITNTFQVHFQDIYRNKISLDKLNYVSAYAFSAAFGIIDHWYETGKNMSTSELLVLLHTLISTGVSRITEQQHTELI